MDPFKETRWRQRFENFEKSYKLLEKYAHQEIRTELERAGFIHFFEITFDLAWQVLKDYLDSKGFLVNSPRETIKQAFQIGIIDDGHTWLDALAKRNLTTHTYDEELAERFVSDITRVYIPLFKALYEKLTEELEKEQEK